MQNMKNYKNLTEYLIDEEGLTFKEAMSTSKDYNNNLEKYIRAKDICSSVKIYNIGEAYSLVCCNDRGRIIYGAEFNFDDEEIFEYMSIDDLEFKLNEEFEQLTSEEIREIAFEELEEEAEELISEDEGSYYTSDQIDFINEHGGLFDCLKGACCEYGYNITDISDESSAYSIAYAWAYNNEKPSACLSYLEEQDY